MDFWMLILCVFPTIVLPITVSSNGNSPETKMIGGMRVDTSIKEEINQKIIMNNTGNQAYNIPKLAINERYRRLIPYMTFYYANDVVPPTTNGNVRNAENVEVDKAVILESSADRPSEREPKLIYKPHRYKNIPRYNGNRLTQFNIASSNPTKIFYKEIPVLYQNSPKAVPHYNNHRLEDEQFDNRDVPFDHYVPKQIKAPSTPFTVPDRKPPLNIYQHEDFSPNVQYYSSDQQETLKYRLIPYDQTPPVKVIDTSKKYYNSAPVISKESFFVKPRPILRPQAFYENHNSQQLPQQTRKPATISEVYYERQPASALVEPVVESGFKPIFNNPSEVTKSPIYTSPVQQDEISYHNYHVENQKNPVVDSTLDVPRDNSYKQQYIIEQPTVPVPTQKQESSNSVTLAELLNSLQINKSIPKPITRENVGDSIRTLLNVLSTLKAAPLQNEGVAVSTPKPFEPPEISHVTPLNSVSSTTPKAEEPDEESYLAPIQTPSQYLDDYPTSSGSTQRFPLPVTSDEEGGTPGRPGVDYPILTVIPTTKFNCKTQRYKGFFADTETRCQVWHYCDLNGGQASFLCPNGTIFSQAALTCDWWFNVRCASTTQLYVLNESLYKYILPHSPKFPEDYSGPLVDKYLTLKFKEMEEQFKKNKKKTAEKNDSGENESTEKINSAEESTISEKANESSINRADVIIETPGNSGNVQRLQDE